MLSKAVIYITVFSASLLYVNHNVNVVKWEELEQTINTEEDTTYIINFWATWCKPCVQELPYFEKVNEEAKGSNVKVILVSLDMVEELETKLTGFLQKKNIRSAVWLLDEVDGNKYIDKVDTNWSGAIPATLIYNNKTGHRFFKEGEMTYDEIKKNIK